MTEQDDWGQMNQVEEEDISSESSSGEDTVPDEYKNVKANDLEMSQKRRSDRKENRR